MQVASGCKCSLIAALLAVSAGWGKTYEALKGESTLGYHLTHPMHKIHGVSRDVRCSVDLTPDTVTSKIRVSVDVKTFDSGNSNRDSHALEVIQGMKYPRVEFVSDSVGRDGSAYRVFGQLTFHGVTRPVNFQVTPHFTTGKVEITGGFSVKLSDYKVERPSLLLVPVEDKLDIDIDLFAKLD